MARENVTVRLSAKINRPLVYAALLFKTVGEWLLSRAVKVEERGA